jgi:hypothetical protein
MTDLKEVRETIEVPKNTGIKGFLHTIERILRQPRVQEIHIDGSGKVTYRLFASPDENPDVGVDYEFIQPNHIIRNADIKEITPDTTNAAIAMAQLFEEVASEHLYPVAFSSGADTAFYRWFHGTTGKKLRHRDTLFGLPFLLDRHFDDNLLFLCAAYGREAAFVDTRFSVKLDMRNVTPVPMDVVDVILP